jgi:hypothetical protein
VDRFETATTSARRAGLVERRFQETTWTKIALAQLSMLMETATPLSRMAAMTAMTVTPSAGRATPTSTETATRTATAAETIVSMKTLFVGVVTPTSMKTDTTTSSAAETTATMTIP